jgi:nucleotide-binding universal stress UspA family protein
MEREPASSSFIIVGIDGSASALSAVAVAAHEAKVRQAALRIVHAYIWQLLDVPDGAGPGVPGLHANAERQLAEATEVARRTAPDTEVDTQLVSGWPVPVLIDASRGAALTIIGSHGDGRVVSGLVGSTAIELAAASHSPLMVVRSADASGGERAADAPIVAGVDGSDSSTVAARFAAAEAALLHAPLHVVQIRPSPHDEEAARALVEQLRDETPGLEIEFRAIAGHVVDELVQASEYARMVVVGTRGRAGLVGLVLGSVSHALFEHAVCPIVVMPRRFVQEVQGAAAGADARTTDAGGP